MRRRILTIAAIAIAAFGVAPGVAAPVISAFGGDPAAAVQSDNNPVVAVPGRSARY